MKRASRLLLAPVFMVLCISCTSNTGGVASNSSGLKINQIQFVGSHNSYKQAMSAEFAIALRETNPQAAAALEYDHLPLSEQLDLGMRKMELDVFYDPASATFPVGHVQQIDMNSHCAILQDCLRQLVQWSNGHPRHVPIWISFNAKDGVIDGLPDPVPFDSMAFTMMDEIITDVLRGKLIQPADVGDGNKARRQWPDLADARGKFLLILDEQGRKRELYLQDWYNRPMFTNIAADHPAAAVMIINDPIEDQLKIRGLVQSGYMVRTRADADTREARSGDIRRREAALTSGAQAVSTDYYLPANHFNTDYQVSISGVVRCNPVSAPATCRGQHVQE